MAVLMVYVGLLMMLVGFASLLKPIRFLRIGSRLRGAVILGLGFLLAVVGAALPAPLRQPTHLRARIDEFMPAYHFHEVHSIRVHAPPDRVFRAIKAVTAQEIRFFRALMGIRGLPARLLGRDRPPTLMPNYHVKSHDRERLDGHDFAVDHAKGKTRRVEGRKAALEYEIDKGAKPAGMREIIQTYEEAIKKIGGSLVSHDDCGGSTLRIGKEDAGIWIELAAYDGGTGYRLMIVEEGGAEKAPILDVFTRSGFLLLAEETDRDIVIGSVMQFGKVKVGGGPPSIKDPPGFLAFDQPGYAKVTFNFHVKDEGGGWSRVDTETRILATDPSARRAFAVYWRLIYPGSATIRREWLQAVKRRAEHAALSGRDDDRQAQNTCTS